MGHPTKRPRRVMPGPSSCNVNLLANRGVQGWRTEMRSGQDALTFRPPPPTIIRLRNTYGARAGKQTPAILLITNNRPPPDRARLRRALCSDRLEAAG